MTLIYFILVLGITILIHEFGHYIFAKRAGVYIYEFAIGMGPKIFSFKRKNDETIYSIRIFPIGGFVSLAGEEVDNDNNVPDEKKLYNKSWIDRFLTIIAGVTFNFILAIILLFIIGLLNGVPLSKPVISSIDENYPLANQNINIGDTIVAINNKKISSTDRLILELQINNGKTIEITLNDKNGNEKTVTAKPILTEKNGESSYAYGFTLDSTKEYSIINSIKYAFEKTISLIEQMFFILFYLLTGKLNLNNLAGPIGMFTIVGSAAKAGIINILYLIAYLCINVGFINLIPFPAFDGGRVLMLVIEKIKGKKIDPRVENIIHSVGFIFLIILMVIVTYHDILRLFK